VAIDTLKERKAKFVKKDDVNVIEVHLNKDKESTESHINKIRFISLIVSAVIVVLALTIFIFLSNYWVKQEKVIDEISAGTIVEKKIEDLESTTDYRIYIGIEYEFEGKEYTSTKYFSVDMDTYLDYEIGDWFDIANLDNSQETDS
jgi:hypothetical protein